MLEDNLEYMLRLVKWHKENGAETRLVAKILNALYASGSLLHPLDDAVICFTCRRFMVPVAAASVSTERKSAGLKVQCKRCGGRKEATAEWKNDIYISDPVRKRKISSVDDMFEW